MTYYTRFKRTKKKKDSNTTKEKRKPDLVKKLDRCSPSISVFET